MDVKDGLQEVPKCDKWSRRPFLLPRKPLSAPEDVSALRQWKKTIKPNP
jgi:hypothetical protein